MKTRISLICVAAAFAGSAYAAEPTSSAMDAPVSMSVEARAPLRAVLLPTVSVDATQATSDANPARMRVADTAPLEVTLMPTVRVHASASPALSVTTLPVVRVVADASSEPARLPEIADETDAQRATWFASRFEAMP